MSLEACWLTKLCACCVLHQTEITCPVNETKTHVANIGRMIEDMETELRSNLNELYILKSREIVNSIRSLKSGPKQEDVHVQNLIRAVTGHAKSRVIDSENN